MDSFLSRATAAMYLAAVPTLIATSIKPASYGRYAASGTSVPARLAWFLFESPNLLVPACLTLLLPHAPLPTVNATLLMFFLIHYFHRALIYPFLRMPQTATSMPVSVVLAAAFFCCCNSSLQYVALLLHHYPETWFYDPRFISGTILAITGMAINIHADSILLRLRTTGRYQIPYGALFRFVSCPNFLGEILQWTGWAIACWSHSAAAFALYTFCNTAPRAWSHHHFYKRRFEDYPNDRRALIPFVL